MSKMSCEAKEDIAVIIHNICHYKKLHQKKNLVITKIGL
jgi:hypothetical protein